MSLGVTGAWRAMQPKKKKCERCGLYYTQTLNQCSHCGDLDDQGLARLLRKHEQELEGSRHLGKYFLLGALIILALLLYSFI